MQTNIPVLVTRGKSIAEAWENSLIILSDNGCRIKTQYDKPDDPPSIDASMTIEIEDPLAEPVIHKDFPGGLEDLQEYLMEVRDGIKDHLTRDPNDPNDTRWEYTYHDRLFNYTSQEQTLISKVGTIIPLQSRFNQIEMMAQSLAKAPHSRRCQAVTWKVWEDSHIADPACLQSIWCRMLKGDDAWYLNMNVRFRSNDAYKAAFMNMFALVYGIQLPLAARIAELMKEPVKLGRYCHFADSYHIYGSYFKEFEERFLGGLKRRSFEERTFNYADVKDIMEGAIPAILEKVKKMS